MTQQNGIGILRVSYAAREVATVSEVVVLPSLIDNLYAQ
jgi:hypothetical protein